MSYETNPILNRIKVIKGWKNPTFPTQTLNYSRDMVLWFKVYLFLKVYLWCQKIRLLTCEIRLTQGHQKILYLTMSKHLSLKKHIRSRWRTKPFLQKIQSPLNKRKSKKARFLLYQDLQILKRRSDFFFNPQGGINKSKAWFSKNRFSVWINFAYLIYARRKFQIKQNHSFWRKKQNLILDKKNWTQAQKLRFQSNKQNLVEKRNLVLHKRQKNFGYLLSKSRKNLFFLKKILFFVQHQKANFPKKLFSFWLTNLTKKFQQLNLFLNQLQLLYQFWNNIQKQSRTNKKSIFFSEPFLTQFFWEKTKIKVRHPWLFFKNKSNFLQKHQLFFVSRRKRICFNQIKKKNSFRHLFVFGKTFSLIQKKLWNHNWHANLFLPKIQFFRISNRFKRQIQLFTLGRWAQKKKLFKFDKKESWLKKAQLSFHHRKTLATSRFESSHHLHSLKKKKQFSYRLSVRQNFRNYLTLKINLKLKYVIENLLQQYFSLPVCVKLSWPLTQFKNLKFYRLFFPEWKIKHLEEMSPPFMWNPNLQQQKQNYLYLGLNTQHLQLQTSWDQKKKKSRLFNKLGQKQKKTSLTLKTWAKKDLSPARLWQKTLNKINPYFSLKKKLIQAQGEKRLFNMSKQRFMPNLITTLTLFVKYLEPQPLADHLAKLIGETKKHSAVFKITSILLRTLPMKRGLGYRIALSGRFNGRDKRRTVSITKLNRNRPRQTFSKNVNFAMAKARATIGAFGIKIWVYT